MDKPRPGRSSTTDLLDALKASIEALGCDLTVFEVHRTDMVKHRSWCEPTAHADDRCVSAAIDVSPHLGCWLVDRDLGPAVILDLGHTSTELSLHEACDLAAGLFDLIDQGR
ncbi:MAG: hypothetical protein ACRC0L_04435 [Angustibacter sp.]